MSASEVESWVLSCVGATAPAQRLQARLNKARTRGGLLPAPAALAHDLALDLGALPEAASAVERAGACLYAAADLADDVTDGASTAGTCDVERLLLMLPLTLSDGGLPPEQQLQVLHRLGRGGLAMALGQEQDVACSGRPAEADPWAIAEAKAGEELGALFASAALVAGVDPTGPERFGRHWGAALQALSDLEDLFSPGESPDWSNASPSGPMARLLSHPRWGETAATWLAGTAPLPARHAVRRGLLASAGLHTWIDEVTSRWLVPAEEQATALPAPTLARCLTVVRDRFAHWRAQLAPVPSPRRSDDRLTRDVRQAQAAGRAWLEAEPTLRETEEVHRFGLFGESLVVGGLFGRLLVLLQLQELPWDLTEARSLVRSMEDVDGWRYYPGARQIPPDADDTGLALQVLREAPEEDRARWAEQLLRTQRPDGSFPVWLGAPEGPWRWDDRDCPGVQANALRGLLSVDGIDAHAMERATACLDAQLASAVHSPHYGTVLRDGLALEALASVQARGPGAAAAVERLRHVVERPLLSGGLHLAVAATALHAMGAQIAWGPVVRRLTDLWQDCGAVPSDDIFRTVHRHGARQYRSRAVSTAWALRALALADMPALLRPRSTGASSAGVKSP